MIDWLSLSVSPELLRPEVLEYLKSQQSHIICVAPDGEITWDRPGRVVVRSDSHQITMELGAVLRIYGSPARVGLKSSDNVFGSSDPVECATRMINFLSSVHSVQLPAVRAWKCSRIDVTHNYFLGDIASVKTALSHLRNAEGGRFQVRTCAESVYWSVKSTYRSGKAYSKGEHMLHLAKRGKSFLDAEKLKLTEGLLRLELSLKRHFFSKQLGKPWFRLTEDELNEQHEKYFGSLIGDVEVKAVGSIEKRCLKAAQDLGLSPGYGKSAFMSWSVIRNEGIAYFKDRSSKSTYYRHKRILQQAGLGWADLCAGKVVPIRRHKLVLGQPVSSWAELRLAA